MQKSIKTKHALNNVGHIIKFVIVPFILFSSMLSTIGCSFPGVYKINVQQGTIISQEMLDQLKQGMTTKQVHFVLGTPSAPNAFDSTTDTYVYSFQKAGKETKSQIITIHYDQERRFERYSGEPMKEQPAY